MTTDDIPAPAPAAADPTPAPTPTGDPAPAPAADPTPKQIWPDDWRDQMAGGDAELRKRLDRFNDPTGPVKSWAELHGKVSAGEYKKEIPYPKDGTPEQVAEWRKEAGIPESWDKYDLKFDDGLVVNKEDMPYLDDFLQKAHEKNLPPAALKTALSAYVEMTQELTAREVESQREFTQQQDEALRQKWGPEFIPNKNMAENFAVSRFGGEVGKALMAAGADTVEAIAAIARELNPAATVVPNSSNPSQTIADELNEMKKIIGTPEWHADTKKQARYMQLIDAQSRMAR